MGALAAVLYGFTGLVMNHRMGENAWPQGDSRDAGAATLQIPAEARTSPERLSLWLQETQDLDVQSIRKGGPGGRGGDAGQPPKWNFSGGTAAHSWQLGIRARRRHRRTEAQPADVPRRDQPPAQGGRRWRRLAGAGRQLRDRDGPARPVRIVDVGARAQLPADGRERVLPSTLVFLLVVVPALL